MTVPTLVEDSSKLVISPLNQLITIRLEEDNFLLWRFQVENTIKGYGLEGFIYGTNQVPSKFLTGPNNETVPNTAYITYQREDHFLISWLLASIGFGFLLQLIGCSIAQEVWSTISQLFNSLSTAKIMHYKHQMQVLKKENLFVREYLMKMKTFSDMLAAARYHGTCGRGQGRSPNGNRPQCQLCGKIGHTVQKCYYRFDISFTGNDPSSSSSNRSNSL
ncbi:hypothetical protein PVL29_003733 [Vitis rotundifolia]|uniref:Retrotransposon Copia-like N-terminal domain-containing protein n=1 Tax=Vitis rotundifolia TaxID=103349 RepID=A0AA39AEX4_VITRO|nr:hypothetical protein PVL29_003733 [Vitis rotundifolia]